MNFKLVTRVLLSLALSLGLLFCTATARAELVNTPQVMAQPSDAAQDRALIQAFVARQDVQKQLESLGLSHVITAERVALLSDSEAKQLARKIREMPAGGNLSNLSSSDIIIILLVMIVLILVL